MIQDKAKDACRRCGGSHHEPLAEGEWTMTWTIPRDGTVTVKRGLKLCLRCTQMGHVEQAS